MSHRVRHHLRLEIDSYDREIRRFIPGYEEMLTIAAKAALVGAPRRVLDVGTGTGALAATVLDQSEDVIVELLDIDPEMLDQARARLGAHGERAVFTSGSFDEKLPPCEAAVSSLALHHVPTLAAKVRVYAGIFAALSPGGVLVNADATVPDGHDERRAMMRSWADHLVASGIAESRAWEHFDEWAEEDTYFPLEKELESLEEAGFDAECVWQTGPMSVLVARKPETTR